ncbi:hypothetical protein GCM10027259_20880 [Micromonospora palomenae]
MTLMSLGPVLPLAGDVIVTDRSSAWAGAAPTNAPTSVDSKTAIPIRSLIAAPFAW